MTEKLAPSIQRSRVIPAAQLGKPEQRIGTGSVFHSVQSFIFVSGDTSALILRDYAPESQWKTLKYPLGGALGFGTFQSTPDIAPNLYA